MEKLNINEKKQRNYSLDFLKIISAFMIVCIHFKFSGSVGEVAVIIGRFAVPVFFMISGYYSYNVDCRKIKNKILHIAKIYFCALVLYFCFNIAVFIYAGQYREAIWYASTYFRIRYVLTAVLFNESLTAMHLWFMGALIYSYLIQYFIVRMNIKDRIVYVASGVLLMINIAFGVGPSVFGIPLPAFLAKNYILRNFLFLGFPLFAFGQLLRKKEDSVLNGVKNYHIAILIIIAVVEAFVMRGIAWKKDLYAGSLLMGFALFVIALKMKNKTYNPKILAVFNTSTNVYLIHIMVGDIMGMTPLGRVQFYQSAEPVFVFGISVIVALIINRIGSIKKKNNNKAQSRLMSNVGKREC